MKHKELLKKIKYTLNFLPDPLYIQLYYFAKFHKLCDFKNPKTFNEKLQWLKLNDRNPLYVQLVDKVEVKKYVAEKIGSEHIIPTFGVWNDPNEIDFDILPEQFVLKCNHDSGNVIICKDKKNFDKEAANRKLTELLKQNFYYIGREWPYKNVPRKILAEQYMVDEFGGDLKDYKIFNFNGEPKVIQVDYGRFIEHKRNLYSMEWKYIEAAIQYPTDAAYKIARPGNLEEMLKLAKILSNGFPHVRTDFYLINEKVYFGEMTFYHGSGFEKFMPESFGLEMGNWIKLPSEKDTF